MVRFMEEIITSEKGFSKIKNNTFEGKIPKMTNSKVIFKGKGNILYVEEGVTLENSTIIFNSNNSIIYLSKSKQVYYLDASVNNNSVLYIGKENYFNGTIHLIASDQKNIIIGDNGMFSFNIQIRVSDGHAIYDANTHTLINNAKSIYIGDHCWIGFGSVILKGSKIGSGSIVGAYSVVANKKLCSNASFAGNPVRLISKNIFFTKESTKNYLDVDMKLHKFYDQNDFIYENIEEDKIPFDVVDEELSPNISNKEKLVWIKNNLVNINKKNRFFIDAPAKKKGFFPKWRVSK